MSRTFTARDTVVVRDPQGNQCTEPIALHYDAANPLFVELTFEGHVTGDQALTWEFSRHLLADGLVLPSGLCDVRVTTIGSTVYVALKSDKGEVFLRLRRAWLVLFVRRIYHLVPRGKEGFDVVIAAESLLGWGAA